MNHHCLRYAILLATTFVPLVICGSCRPKHDECAMPTAASDSVAAMQPKHSASSPKQDTVAGCVNPSGEEITLIQGDTISRTDALFCPKKKRIQFTADQFYGEWIAGTLHECYFADSTGLQWDTKDDVSRQEAQHFFWSLTDNNRLMQVYTMGVNGIVPRDYDVTLVNEESLVYKDAFGNAFRWNKMQETEGE